MPHICPNCESNFIPNCDPNCESNFIPNCESNESALPVHELDDVYQQRQRAMLRHGDDHRD